MAYSKQTLNSGSVPKRLDKAPVSADMAHSLRVPHVAGILTAVGMSRTESGKLVGPAAELSPNHPKARPATRPIVDDETAGAVRDRTSPAPVHPGTRSRNDDPLN